MTAREIDCMACVANLAAGFPGGHDETIRRNGMTHGVHWDMASGIARPACAFSLDRDAWTVDIGPSRGWRIE